MSTFKKLFYGVAKAFFFVLPLLVVSNLFFNSASLFYMGGGFLYIGGGLVLYYFLFNRIRHKISRKQNLANGTKSASYTLEASIVGILGDHPADFNTQDFFPFVLPIETINIRAYKDADEPLASYRTFDFDYTNKTNPLLEKELFRQLENVLQVRGLTRVEKNPQIIISMDFFIGKKEQYTPPSTVTSTEIKSVWSYGQFGGNWGGLASLVPIVSSHTTSGYTTTSYYSNIRLNFLNHSKLVKGVKLETPPLIWIGESDSEGVESDIRKIAPVMFGELMGEFPNQSSKTQKRCIVRCYYGGLGLGFNQNDWRVVRYVEPFSVAEEHGIKPGDTIIKVNGNRASINWVARGTQYLKSPKIYRSKDPYFQYVFSNRGDLDVELVIQSAETGKNVTLTMRPRTEGYGRYLSVDMNPHQKIVRANPLGIIFVVFSTAIAIYYIFLR
jgi:hypothetical protein